MANPLLGDENDMKIVVLEGSPNRKGSSNLLAAEFIHGAEDAGHSVTVVDAGHEDIHPCGGCVHCGYEGPCAQKDSVGKIRKMILEADMMVFVTPLYYYGMSAGPADETPGHISLAYAQSARYPYVKPKKQRKGCYSFLCCIISIFNY